MSRLDPVSERSGRSSRREFCVRMAAGVFGTALLGGGRLMAGENRHEGGAQALARELLMEWGEGMLRQVVHAPADLSRHGALACPACAHIHGRCMDAVYPFLHLAKLTGDARYIDAAHGVMAWAETNVSQPNGSWTVIANPKSWAGISVFGAIALAEALHHHGDLLDRATYRRWTERLRRAADYVHRVFTLDFTNINYPATATYGLHLCGTVLNEPAFLDHAATLARGVPAFLSEPTHLLTGEGKPSTARSARGLPPIDLGYNVEESLVALALYAVDAGDRDLENQLVEAWRGHLLFMLPDGGWDNSWGTRHAKWTYWGSRTTDGCQPGLAVLAHRDPAFGVAARRNLELLRASTVDGLLAGGPHYAARGAPPCVHHTFTHAKALAALLDRGEVVEWLDVEAALPRARAHPLLEVPEIATWLVARGKWRATVTAYDFVYRPDTRQPTGGAVSLLWHEAIGPVCAGSMARYIKVEVNNMQDDPHGRADVLTPRVEAEVHGRLYSQLWDTEADVRATAGEGEDAFEVVTTLRDETGNGPADALLKARIVYRFSSGRVAVHVRLLGRWPEEATVRLVWPVIALPSEVATPVAAAGQRRWRIERTGGTMWVESDLPLTVPEAPQRRWFSLTPGFCAVPLTVTLAPRTGATAALQLSIESSARPFPA